MEVEKLPVELCPCDDSVTGGSQVCVELKFTSRHRGLHRVDVRWRGLPVTGSPFHVNVVTAHAPESAEDDRVQRIDAGSSDNSAGHITTAVLRRTSKVIVIGLT